MPRIPDDILASLFHNNKPAIQDVNIDGIAIPRIPDDPIQDITLDEPPSVPQVTFDLKCADCGAKMELRNSKFGLFYGCVRFPDCKGTHGAYKNGTPFGTPGDAATKLARMEAHKQFDRLWDEGGMSRKDAYQWLRTRMKPATPQLATHIGAFDAAQCSELILAVRRHFNEFTIWEMIDTDYDD